MARKEMATRTAPPQQQMEQQQQQQQQQPEPPPFPVKSGFLKHPGETTAAATTKPKTSKQRCRKVGARCRAAGCSARPWFAQAGSRVPKACKNHKEEGEVNIYTPACEADGCSTRPHYGAEGERARFCRTHKLAGMVDVLNRRCAAEGCRRQPSWARTEGARPIFCKEHKDEDMVDTKHRTCLHPGCTRFPSKSGGTVASTTTTSAPSSPTKLAAAETAMPTAGATGPARYCALHAPAGAANVTAARCKHPGGCSVQPCFGREGGGKGAGFCARHRRRGMTDIRNPRCVAVGCAAQPRCGREGDPRPQFCLRHAEPDMVNFR
ncbi:unnamed protein product [Scytosiphon promiscuus]